MPKTLKAFLLFLACIAGGSPQSGLAENHRHGKDGAHHSALQAVMGRPGPLIEGASQILGARFLDVDGNIRRLGDENGPGPAVLVFVDKECPVSARYLGELNEFASLAAGQGADFYAVVSSPYRDWGDARAIRDEYDLDFPVLLDPSGDLAERLKPVTLGEAFVIDGRDRMVYRGRIDDRFAGIGQLRRVIRHHDLKDVLATVNDPGLVPRATAPIGCFFEAWKTVGEREVTYSRDIQPLLAANCVVCHQDGGVAPFALTSFEQAASRAGMLEYVTGEGLMPPWRPKPHHGRFRDERYLSDVQVALFAAWSDGDAPKGADRDKAPPVKLPDPGWRLGKPDLVLSLLEPFPVPATGEDVYRYFVIPSGLVTDKTVVAIDFRPGDPAVVHHANFFADYSGKGRREDARDPLPGFSVFGTGEFMSYDNTEQTGFGIGGWAPGAEPYQLPEDVGLWLPGGADIVVEIHYKLNGRATSDQSSIGLYFDENHRSDYVDGLLIGTQDLEIPAGEAAYTRHVSMDVPVGFRLVDVMPHMHYIGARTRMTVTLPDGRVEPVFGIEDWDIRWQNIYTLREPLHIPAGSRIDAWFVYDNSAENYDNPHDPPKRIRWGWKSEDEMAEVWMGVIPEDPERRLELIEASMASWHHTDSRPLP